MRIWCAVLGVMLDHPFIPVYLLVTAALLLFAYSFVWSE